jgi:uncharacterized protein (DUF2345 family)
LYPDSNTIAITGPIWLPRIYGKDLTAFEIASSGKIAISLNDIHTLDISRSNYVDGTSYKNTIVSQSNYSLEMLANGTDLQIMMDAYSNNISVKAASNISIAANSGNMTMTTSNNMVVSASNNYSLQAQSNVNLNAAKGSATISANNSNMYMIMNQTTNSTTVYASNNIAFTACNNIDATAMSNVRIGALAGDFKAYADSSNMYVTMEKATDNVTLYTASNIFLVASNNTSLTSKSNITMGALAGDFKAYADSSNMYMTMERTTDNITLYTSSNMFLSASNNYNLNAKSNINVGALAGDLNLYANSSNMFVTMTSGTNNVSMFASNNLNVSVSNNYNTWANSNISLSTVGGDYRLYVNSSNMFMRMSATTNNINVFSSNNTIMSASNNFDIYALSNLSASTSNGSLSLAANSSNMYLSMNSALDTTTMYASNDMYLSASNSLRVNAQSNINIGALAGDFKAYADSSNMYMTMERTTDTVTLYTSSNMFVSASNNYNLQAKSNINLNALAGDVRVAANNSNMTFTMSQATNNVSLFTSNNFNVSVSNSMNTYVLSNIAMSTLSGDIKMYANSSNMYLVMDRATNNTSLYTSNSFLVSVSNELNTWVRSNYNISTVSGDFNVSANSSNMYLYMDADTNNTSVFTSNNMTIGVSNNYNTFVNSNMTASTKNGSYQLYVNSSNMFMTMDHTTNNTTLFTSNNYQVSVSNNMNVNTKSNINIGALSGDFKVYANSSNMFVTMDRATNTTTVFASNNMFVSASNTYNLNANSNILVGALNGDFKVYSQKSNMYMTMDSATNDVSMFASNNMNVSVSNNYNVYVQSNVLLTANRGDLSLYANSSNMYMVMDRTSNNISTYASNNIFVSSSNSYTLSTYSNVSVSAGLGSLNMYATNSNMYMTMDAATRNTSMYTSNNMNVSVSNNYNLNVQSNINVGALGGDFKVYADSSNMYMTMDRATDNVTVYASSNMFLSASNNYNLNAKSNINVGALNGDFKVYADSSNMYLTMDKTTNNVTLYTLSNMFVSASNNYNLNARSNIYVGALGGDMKLYANSSNMYMTMDATTNTQSIYTVNQMNLTASNSFSLNAQSNITMNATVNNITMYASNDYTISTSNNYTVTARSNVLVNASKGSWNAYANDSNMFMTMNHTTNTVSLYGLNQMNFSTSNNLNMSAQSNMAINAYNGNMLVYADSNLKMNVDDSNMFLHFNMPSDAIQMYSLSNISFSASNNMFLTASSNISMTTSNLNIISNRDVFITASNNVTISASNTLTLSFGALNTLTSNDQAFTAQSNVFFYINASSNNPSDPVFTVSGNQVLVRGDIVVTGNINTSNVFSTTVIQESLKVSDKQLTLANVGSNFNPADGPFDGIANSGAGIKIDGVPSGFDSNIPQAYDKSFNWNFGGGNGILDLGTASGMSNEAFWEVKGGSLRITHQKITPSGGSNIIRDISFGLRVNELEELELVKKFWYTPSNNYIHRRIARFGRIL